MSTSPIQHGLEVDRLSVEFRIRGVRSRSAPAALRAVNDVSLTVEPGEVLGVVGESGSGKSTLCRVVVGLERPHSGHVRLDGVDLCCATRKARRAGAVQMIFQNSQDSLDPRQSVARILKEAADVVGPGGTEAPLSPMEALSRVGLSASYLKRRASQLSGGQAQRVAIARAIATRPSVLILDEPVSALDVSLQSQILNLLIDLQRESGTSYLFVTHDLAVARQVADRVAVMYDGRVIEIGSAEDVLAKPVHPYTRALIDAVPRLGTRPDSVPEPSPEPTTAVETALDPSLQTGCTYRPRCLTWLAHGQPPVCVDAVPQLEPIGSLPTDHEARCHFALSTSQHSRGLGRVGLSQ